MRRHLSHPVAIHLPRRSTTRASATTTTPALPILMAVGYSYSNNALAAAGFTSGTTVKVSNINFTWPTVAAGVDDNWQANGQTIAVAVGQRQYVGIAWRRYEWASFRHGDHHLHRWLDADLYPGL